MILPRSAVCLVTAAVRTGVESKHARSARTLLARVATVPVRTGTLLVVRVDGPPSSNLLDPL